MNFAGFQPKPIERWSSLVEQDDVSALPLGVLAVARNVKFHLTSVRTRDGLNSAYGFTTSFADAAISGLAPLKYTSPSGAASDVTVPLVYDMAGRLYYESPAGSGTLLRITTSSGVVLPANSHLLCAPAYNRGYLALSDLKSSTANPAVYDLATGVLDPLSMKLFGQNWTANTVVQVGEVITPTATGGNGHTYRCTTAGTTGATEPVWNTGTGSTTNDGTAVWTETTLAIAQSAVVGNICSGTRYAVVLYENRNGYITGMTDASVVSYNTGSSGFKIDLSHIATGPVNTAKRIVAFTKAGASSAGPFFYIPSADVVSGVSITSTVINDNTSTTATFNFTDDYLGAATNVTAYFRKIQLTGISDCYFAKSLGRMVYKADALPSGFYISLEGDPESVYGDTGLVEVAENNGQRAIAWREFQGIQYALKERGGHVVTPSPTDPSTWDVEEKWTACGPCGPRAVDVCSSFMAFVDRRGLWIYTGSGKPERVSKEVMPKTFASVNWAYQHLVWVLIDEETKEILIGAPTGQSTLPNAIIKCNYEEADGDIEGFFTEPIHFSPYVGKEIASGSCRKWSVDDINAMCAMRCDRALNDPNFQLDARFRQSQLLFGSSNANGVVNASVPYQFNDNGGGIESIVESAAPAELLRISQLGGVTINMTGGGLTKVEIVSGRNGTVTKLPDAKMADLQNKSYEAGASGTNERFRLRISNGKTPDSWFDVRQAYIYARPLFSARTGAGN